ncbi:Putative oxygen oxidoreductase covalent FAD-binding, berberine/berberine [Septoria linicola]|uniref:Oxygen oxidoreductase covalent FAD-binding, berberine/berberine n=1 Tax=Septoria linicola TaxID=215465 RepID=A0A9Q9ENN9_9PEZI|nr:Putative oxygen oxidoreductase covalent FAD-binding, berberine/berberine [Septoria linicola]
MLAKTFVAAAAVGYANARAFTRQDNSFEGCVAKAVGGKTDLYSLPSGADYATSLNIYNLDHIYIPSAVAWPTCAEEVAALVKCASAAGVAVQAQSGGHSYLNFGLGGQNASLSIRLSHLDDITYDKSDKTVTFGTGNLLSNLTEKLDSVERTAAFSGIGSIGTGGHFTIGGLGPLSRIHGLAADQIEEVEVVLANGSIVTASEDENEDLFFAVRGAAWSFGIVTSIKLKTQDIVPATSYSYIVPGNSSTLASVLSAWQALIAQEDLPREFASTAYIYEGFALLTGSYYGSKEDFAKVGLSNITANASELGTILDVLDQLNVTATVNLLQTLQSTGLLEAITSLPASDILLIFNGILQILPTIETGNLTAIQQAAQTTNSTLLGAAFAFLEPATLEALFSNMTTSGALTLLSNTTTLASFGPILYELNFTSIVELVDQIDQAGFLDFLTVGGGKLSSLFSTLFTSHLPSHFYAKSLKFAHDNLPSVEATEEILNYIISNATDPGTPLWFVVFDLAGGAINEIAQDATAYWHRDALVWLQSYTVNLLGAVTDVQKDFLGGLSEKVQELVPGVDDSAYAGYVDDALDNAAKSYWGGNVEKLKEIKAKYDAKNVFKNGQSIEV